MLFISNHERRSRPRLQLRRVRAQSRVGRHSPDHQHSKRRIPARLVSRRTHDRVPRHEARADVVRNDDGRHARLDHECGRLEPPRAWARQSTIGSARHAGRPMANRSTPSCRFAAARTYTVFQSTASKPTVVIGDEGSVESWALTPSGGVMYGFASPSEPADAARAHGRRLDPRHHEAQRGAPRAAAHRSGRSGDVQGEGRIAGRSIPDHAAQSRTESEVPDGAR